MVSAKIDAIFMGDSSIYNKRVTETRDGRKVPFWWPCRWGLHLSETDSASLYKDVPIRTECKWCGYTVLSYI